MPNKLNKPNNLDLFIEGSDSLFPEISAKNMGQILNGCEECHLPLTILTEGGEIHQHESEVKLRDNVLEFDLPLNWQIPDGFFHLFFQGVDNCWYFIPGSELGDLPGAFSLALTDPIYCLQRRRYKRVSAPSGTRAIFKLDNTIMDSVHVTDISAGGMQVCSGISSERYPVNSLINEIFIAIPPKTNGSVCKSRRIMPLIRQGKIVRSFVDQESHLSCFGVSFSNDSSYVRKNLEELVGYIENSLR